MFHETAPLTLQNILMEADQELCRANNLTRERFIDGRGTQEYEGELKIVNKEEGFFHSHLLMIIIKKLLQLQKRSKIN